MRYLLLALLTCNSISAQLFSEENNSTTIDSLKGSNTPYRNFWDVKKYDIVVEPTFEDKFVKGTNTITFTILKDIKNPTFQIDLQQPMKITKIEQNFQKSAIKTEKKEDIIFITTHKSFKKGTEYTFTFHYEGNPTIAKNAPWDGGWVFAQDKSRRPFMSVAQQGQGVSLWLPTKDYWGDEPDSGIRMTIITPKDLVGVGNGRLIEKATRGDKNYFTWETKNIINPYSIVPSIGHYVNFKDTFEGEKGKLDLDYWVLDYNLERAKHQFKQVHPTLKAFEYWFGPYPFYEDSYKLVETPYLGMEHQSNIAYGNKYNNGYLGGDLSTTGVGLHWDYIIVHETAHEWFANNITAKDRADMWIHEAFTTYAETLFVEHFMSKNDAEKYVQGERINIQNDQPIIGKYGVNHEGSIDMYYKGANMLHTIRQLLGNDQKFREILRGLNKDFYHQTVTTEQIENYLINKTGFDLQVLFNQYLRTTWIPVLEYKQKGKTLEFRYQNIVKGFNLPIKINDQLTIYPTSTWQSVELDDIHPVLWDRNYLVQFTRVFK